MMAVKEARLKAGISQAKLSALTGIPARTIEDWETEKRTPSEWVMNLVVEKIANLSTPTIPKITNTTVEKYADSCIKFSNDSKEWAKFDSYSFYTTAPEGWRETFDNAHGGIDVSWAFHLSDDEIKIRAAEKLFEALLDEINCAIDNDADLAYFEALYNKFSE